MEVIRDLYSLNLLAKVMVLHYYILLSLAIALIAEAIQMQTSAEHVLSLHRVAPRYLKLATSSTSGRLFYICTDARALAMVLLFSVLSSIPYVLPLSTSLLMRS